MFYIIKEYHSMGGGLELPFHSWYEYSIDTNRPSQKDCYVKVDKSKEDLKKLVKSKGSLENALNYLFDMKTDLAKIDKAFE